MLVLNSQRPACLCLLSTGIKSIHNHARSQTDFKVINCHYNYGVSLNCSMPYAGTPFVGFDVSSIPYSIYDLLFEHSHDDDGLINNP